MGVKLDLLSKELRLTVSENRVLRRTLGSKLDEVAGEWRKLHNEELYNLYSFPSVIRQIKSRRMRWAGHVAGMGEEGKSTSTRSWWESRRKETTLVTEA
jgi:hypothetical protein